MIEKELVSVIVPVYNAEKYIGKCLKSIIEQTYPLIEIVVIDDGSSDRSRECIKKVIAENQSERKIIFLQQKNAGVSAARNAGLRECTGSLICFVDADDWVEEKYVVMLAHHMEEPQIDSVSFCIGHENFSGQKENSYYCWNREEAIGGLFNEDEKSGGYCWNKIFRASIIEKNQIKFREDIQYMEDLMFSFDYLSHINKAIHFEQNEVYHYVKNLSSATVTRRYGSQKSMLKVMEYFMSHSEMFNFTDLLFVKMQYANAGVWLTIYMFRENKYLPEEIRYNLSCAKRFYRLLNLKHKLGYWGIQLFPRLVFLLCKKGGES